MHVELVHQGEQLNTCELCGKALLKFNSLYVGAKTVHGIFQHWKLKHSAMLQLYFLRTHFACSKSIKTCFIFQFFPFFMACKIEMWNEMSCT